MHTPGPWQSEWDHLRRAHTIYGLTDDGPTFVVALTQVGHGVVVQEEKANARLIAAAPELLRICQQFMAHVNCHYDPVVIESEMGAEARAVMSRATGGEWLDGMPVVECPGKPVTQ